MKFSEIQTAVNELGDGRVWGATKQKVWIKRIRYNVSMDFAVAGFRGLYFLYKEATVQDGAKLNEPRYAIPDDFVDDLNIFFDKKLLDKAAGGVLDITLGIKETGTPERWAMAGVEFDLRPIPSEAVVGKEILLFYNGLPGIITGNDEEDYFMEHFPDLHIFGMGKYANLSIGDKRQALYCDGEHTKELRKLQLHNRRVHFKYARMRFSNWDEYVEAKRTVYPQFVES